jgi:hypothetical protein
MEALSDVAPPAAAPGLAEAAGEAAGLAEAAELPEPAGLADVAPAEAAGLADEAELGLVAGAEVAGFSLTAAPAGAELGDAALCPQAARRAPALRADNVRKRLRFRASERRRFSMNAPHFRYLVAVFYLR